MGGGARRGFDAWNLSLAPGATHATTAAEWADALVVVECGTLRVDCLAGASRTFRAGDHLALGWLPVRRLHNVGSDEMRLVAVRRDPKSSEGERGRDMQFRTTIIGTGGSTAGIRIPDDVLTALDGGKRAAVTVTINGHTYRSSLGTVDGAPMVGVSADNRAKAGVVAGDEVDVTIELDTAPREVEVPEDFARALAADPEAQRTFDGASNSNRRWHVDSINGAKSDETRHRRIAKSIAMLHEGRIR